MDELDLLRGTTTVVILAAGAGSRYGSDGTKVLLPFRGKPLLQHVIDAAAGTEADEILVVIGHDEDAIREAISLPEQAHFVLNLDHPHGLSVSLTAGLMAASPASEAAIILYGDLPEVDASILQRMIDTFRDTRMPVIRVQYRDAPGPLLVSEGVWDEVMAESALAADAGPRAFVDANEDLVEVIEIDAEGPIDVDTPEDYERLLVRKP